MQEKLEFSVHTSKKCFICFVSLNISEDSGENRISLRRICQHLRIDLSKTITVPSNLLSLLIKSDITVNLCLNCTDIVKSLTKLYQQLEVIKLHIEYDFKRLHEQLESVNDNPELLLEYEKELELDSRAKLHSVVVEKLRADLSSKCKNMSSQILPTIRLKRVKWIKPKREPSLPDYEADSPSESIGNGMDDSDSDYFEEENNREPLIENDSQPLIESETENVKIETIAHPKKNQCGICGHVYSTKGNLTAHTRRVCRLLKVKKGKIRKINKIVKKQQKPSLQILQCKLCPLSFCSINGLGTHMTRSHFITKKVRKHECDICQKRFFDTNHLTKHKTIHLGIKFECDLCGKKFSQKGAVNRHKRLKCSGKKIKKEDTNSANQNQQDQYKCDICEKVFAIEQSLKQHVGMVHPIKSELKRFPCSSCSKRFLTPMHLKNHYNTKHLHVRYKCGFCNVTAKSAGQIYVHQSSGDCKNFKKKRKLRLKRVIQLKSTSEIKTDINVELKS